MSGVERRQLQRDNGVDLLVDDLNNLRIWFGNDAVRVTTPKAETTLRKGCRPQIPLNMTVALDSHTVITVSFPPSYPWSEPVSLSDIKVTSCFSGISDSLCTELDAITRNINDFCARRTMRDEERGNHYMRIMPVIEELKNLLAPLTAAKQETSKTAENDETQQSLQEEISTSAADAADSIEGAIVNDEKEVQDMQHFIGCCMFCGRVVFESSDLENHDPPGEDEGKSAKQKKDACTSYFLNKQPDWMQPSHETSGKISCAKCQKKLGLWNWSGSQCSCGTWVVPAFQINVSRVDIKKKASQL